MKINFDSWYSIYFHISSCVRAIRINVIVIQSTGRKKWHWNGGKFCNISDRIVLYIHASSEDQKVLILIFFCEVNKRLNNKTWSFPVLSNSLIQNHFALIIEYSRVSFWSDPYNFYIDWAGVVLTTNCFLSSVE